MAVALYNLSPAAPMLGLGLAIAAGPLVWVFGRQTRLHRSAAARWYGLGLLTLFLTLDLVLFGAFTRLSDSGLGCPDWPGCYGEVSPLAAHAPISAAQAAMPSGPVTVSKAWVEMVHRYLATGVGALITVLMVGSWRHGRPRNLAGWLPTLGFVWVCVQGAFGALTVTMKLFPAIVSAHLLGAYVLLALLVLQVVALRRAASAADGPWRPVLEGARDRLWVKIGLALLLLQAASGAWVSTNYAVLACTTFPLCQGQWWPDMDFARGFEIWRPLGESADGTVLSLPAITAMHVAHRSLAMLTLGLLALLAWRLWKQHRVRLKLRWLGGLLLLQLATGLSNVVLGWPMAAAIVHTGGAAALVVVLVWLLAAASDE